MEIERKFLISKLPENLETYPFHTLEQAYLCTEPVVRVRRSDDEYILTYKGKGLMTREEYNLPLTAESYEHLKAKADGNIICKRENLYRRFRGCRLRAWHLCGAQCDPAYDYEW